MTDYTMEGSDGQSRGYVLAIRVIHWLMALIMISMIIAGLLMVNVFNKFNATTNFLYDYHRGMGFVLMILVIVRLIVYRFTSPPSPLPVSIAPLQKLCAEMVHFLLYAALIIQPLLGWYATNVWGAKKIPIFGLFHLPPLAEKNRELGNQLLEIHGYMGFLIAGLVILHISGALFHLLIQRDGVFQRMIRR